MSPQVLLKVTCIIGFALASQPELNNPGANLKDLEDAVQDAKTQLAALSSLMNTVSNITDPLGKESEITSNRNLAPLPTSFSEVSLTGGSQLDASSGVQGATQCYKQPCRWIAGDKTSKSMGYYVGPEAATEITCPSGMHREWTTCNNGEMQTDGCRGYCAQDPMPGYVSMMSPKMGDNNPFAVRLVTKGELDLLREQLDRRWRTMYESLEGTLGKVTTEVSAIEDHTKSAEKDNGQLAQVIETQKLIAQGMEKALAGSMTELHEKVVNSFRKVEVQNQRTMIAALHGVAGMCCCYYSAQNSKQAKCSWHTFMGDIDQRTTARFLNAANIQSHIDQNKGAVQDVSFAGPSTIRCGTSDEDSRPMVSYASLFAAKSQLESLTGQPKWLPEYGPFYAHHVTALDQCAASPNWKTFIATKVGGGDMGEKDFSNRENTVGDMEFPAYDFEFSTGKTETDLRKKFTNLGDILKSNLTEPAERNWFSVTEGDLSEFAPKTTLQGKSSSLLETGSKAARKNVNTLRPDTHDHVPKTPQMNKPKAFLGPNHAEPSSFAETAAKVQPVAPQDPQPQSQVKAGQGFSVQEVSVRNGGL
eukprot:gnl/MRDRNA2_/MRDRNA2_110023_c0_seq1.p1 gnl/MRDRNA2_/MRDRNA2_110023_c0~~gnl/MRDRNA2_/MRDRNA2_110023_c0_seq1.p1  ORF type:complete len:621 (-),score=108.29 gnl/MRDRNA2_/MRDRNA2_110023_c0_seq1:15-1778(-)